jgi:hypothetical protein
VSGVAKKRIAREQRVSTTAVALPWPQLAPLKVTCSGWTSCRTDRQSGRVGEWDGESPSREHLQVVVGGLDGVKELGKTAGVAEYWMK